MADELGARGLVELLALAGRGRGVFFVGFFCLNAQPDLFSVHGDVVGRGDAEPHLIAFDAEYGHLHAIIDHEALSGFAGKYQHFIVCSFSD